MNKDHLDYVTAVIGALSLKLNLPCSRIYKSLKEADLIQSYLVKGYDILHTLSLEYVADDVITIMKKKGYSI